MLLFLYLKNVFYHWYDKAIDEESLDGIILTADGKHVVCGVRLYVGIRSNGNINNTTIIEFLKIALGTNELYILKRMQI